MRRFPRDPKGYYQVLRLSPGANSAEVQLAYTFLKNAWQSDRRLPRGQIKQAYDCLIDPTTKKDYDAGAARGRGPSSQQWRMVAAIAALVGLLAFGGFVFPGFLLPAPEPFMVGDRVVSTVDGAALGAIVRIEHSHKFPNGALGDAYLVLLSDGGGERWFPTGDLERNYRRR